MAIHVSQTIRQPYMREIEWHDHLFHDFVPSFLLLFLELSSSFYSKISQRTKTLPDFQTFRDLLYQENNKLFVQSWACLEWLPPPALHHPSPLHPCCHGKLLHYYYMHQYPGKYRSITPSATIYRTYLKRNKPTLGNINQHNIKTKLHKDDIFLGR